MNEEQYLLQCLEEECAEIIVDASKAVRFGLDDVNPNDPLGQTNRERLVRELNDLAGVIQMLGDKGVIPPKWGDRDAQKAKREKVLEWMAYSRKKGVVQPCTDRSGFLPAEGSEKGEA